MRVDKARVLGTESLNMPFGHITAAQGVGW